MVPGLAIACDGRGQLGGDVHARADRARAPLALDVSSRSSVGLVRVLCGRHCGIAPEFVDAAPDLADARDRRRGADDRRPGALRAIQASARREKIDLGEAWQAFTGLPFVFAVWVAAPAR